MRGLDFVAAAACEWTHFAGSGAFLLQASPGRKDCIRDDDPHIENVHVTLTVMCLFRVGRNGKTAAGDGRPENGDQERKRGGKGQN
jgi:hypothetical protein